MINRYYIIKNYLTIDAGPMIQYNSQLDIDDDSKENYILEGYTDLTLDAIKDISQLNINGAIGVSAGVEKFRVRAQYIYGFTNIFNNLNRSNLTSGNDTDFKGNQNMLVFSAMINF